MTFNKKDIKTRCKNWVFIFFFFFKGEKVMCFTEGRAERILLFKTYWLAFRIKMGFVNKDKVKKNSYEKLSRICSKTYAR